jgi:hypothetical protein
MDARMTLPLALLLLPLLAGPSTTLASPPDLSGTWKGTLVNEPVRPNAPKVDVLLEIGPMPAADNTCTMWKTTYSEAGVVRQVKDYKLCRGLGPDDLYTDEGDGTKLTARWIGDVLVSPFRVDNLLLVVHTRLVGNVLTEEIVTIDDVPQGKGVQPLKPRSIQRLTFTRASAR